jgi:hypothetical protein
MAEVEGLYRGETVDAKFTRTDGCEIARWDRHAFLFPVEQKVVRSSPTIRSEEPR